MRESECCVCHMPLGMGAKMLGGRAFCDRHLARIAGGRRALWLSMAVVILGLLAFTVVVEVLVSLTRPVLKGGPLVAVGVVLSLVPALAWLAVFYLQDRLEPEPKGHVLGVFALGGVLALTLGMPIIRDVFRLPEWIGRSPWWAQLLGSILIVGFVQEYLKYAAVRYTVYHSPEYDERVDGIVYGAAAGLGFATVLNLAAVVASGGTQLGVGFMRITITTLAQATFSGVMGYFLGRAKFERMGSWWLPAGLCLAASLNGVVTYLLSEVTVRGLTFTPVYGLVLAAVVAAVTFGILFTVINRLNARTACECVQDAGGEA